MTGSLCGADCPTLDMQGRLDSIVMGVNVEFTLHNCCSVSQHEGLTFSLTVQEKLVLFKRSHFYYCFVFDHSLALKHLHP